jgi:hypothetical protein
MLATQDLQPSAGEQLAFEERPSGNSEVAEELLLELQRGHLSQLRTASLAARFASTNEYVEQGFASPIEWIRFNGHLTSVAAADLIAVGENLERLPQTVQAVRDGEIGFPHLKTMARTANFIGGGFDEIKLLPKARDNSAGKFTFYPHVWFQRSRTACHDTPVWRQKFGIRVLSGGLPRSRGLGAASAPLQ